MGLMMVRDGEGTDGLLVRAEAIGFWDSGWWMITKDNKGQ